MELFEKTKKLKTTKEAMTKINDEIIEILNDFVNMRYQTKLIRAGYLNRNNNENVEVCYPELTVPNGFSKENDKYFRMYANVVKHQYTLVDEKNRKIEVIEEANFLNNIIKKDKDNNIIATILFKQFSIISESIYYTFVIDGEEFSFSRKFTYEEMLEQVLEDLNVNYRNNYDDYSNEKSEEAYEKFLKAYDITRENIIPLENIIKCKVRNQIKAFSVFNICFEVSKTEICDDGFNLESPWFGIYISDSKIEYSIKVKLIFKNNEEVLCERVFKYEEGRNKQKYQNGCTLNEILKLYK